MFKLGDIKDALMGNFYRIIHVQSLKYVLGLFLKKVPRVSLKNQCQSKRELWSEESSDSSRGKTFYQIKTKLG